MIESQNGNGEDDPEGRALWAFVTRHIKPLPGREKPPEQSRIPAGNRAISKKACEPAAKPENFLQTAASSASKGREIDRRLGVRLRRGQIPIAARIDLHGLTQEEAKESLTEFILENYRQKHRLVLVITGKGRKKDLMPSTPGILRQRVPVWLDEPPLSPLVLQYCPAKPSDGGDGALYVLLRRQRES